MNGRRINRRGFLVGGSALVLAACAAPGASTQPGAGTSAGKPKAGGTFVYASEKDFTPLVPATSTGHQTHRLLANMCEGLVREDLHDTKSTSLKTVPWLAESWTISPDGLQYTFKLRQGVKFHDGTPFDADAVKANYDRCNTESSPFFDKAAKPLTAQIFNFVAKGEVIDKYTWRYTLKSPIGEFLRLLNDRLLLIASPAALQKYGNQGIADHPTGTGPFKFVERVAGQRIVMEKNADYWGGAPYLDKVIVTIIIDPQARMAALRSGEVDWVLEMLPDQAEVYRKDPNISLVYQPIPHTWFWMLNYREGPTAKKEVRQALNYAWNRDALTKGLLKDLAAPALSPAPPNNPASPPSKAPYTYDPAKAKQLLKDAGYPNGFDMTVMYPITGINDELNSLLQADFKQIGVNVKLEKYENSAFLTTSRLGVPATHGALQTNWTTNAQLGFWLEQMFSEKFRPPSGNNRGWYANPAADKLMEEARPITDPTKSAEAYRKVLDQIVEDAPWLWVFHDRNPVAIHKRVKGLDIAATPYYDLQPVWIDR